MRRVTDMLTESIVLLSIICATVVPSINAQVVRDQPSELTAIDVEEHLADTIPLELIFTDETGRTAPLREFLLADKPNMIVLGYYRCPMLCNLVFNGLVDGINDLGWPLGEKYNIVTISIAPDETPELAAAKKENNRRHKAARMLHRPIASPTIQWGRRRIIKKATCGEHATSC